MGFVVGRFNKLALDMASWKTTTQSILPWKKPCQLRYSQNNPFRLESSLILPKNICSVVMFYEISSSAYCCITSHRTLGHFGNDLVMIYLWTQQETIPLLTSRTHWKIKITHWKTLICHIRYVFSNLTPIVIFFSGMLTVKFDLIVIK